MRNALGIMLYRTNMERCDPPNPIRDSSNESYRAYMPQNSSLKILTNRGDAIWRFEADLELDFPE
ncbi:hypothetical protein SAMN05518855_102261 [Paenibacillus sp. CF384]|nr:hypothetical protein SAMN05518855_102261 [Paenibacillus sp. CF384]